MNSIQSLGYWETWQLLESLSDRPPAEISLNREKKTCVVQEVSQKESKTIHLPLLFPEISWATSSQTYSPVPIPESLTSYLQKKTQKIPSCLVLLVTTGQACIGSFCGEELQHHKVIRKYMKRKKQGKSQISFAKSKGKSREGSRIRLREGLEFFNEIHQKIQEWLVVKDTEVILLQCNPLLLHFLFEVPDAIAFEQKDSRIKRVPFYVDLPSFESLSFVHKKALQSTMVTRKEEG